MADFDFNCPNCGKTLRIDEAHRGKKTTCPSCQAVISIPPKPETAAPQPRLVSTPPKSAAAAPPAAVAAAGAAAAADPTPQEEKDVFRIRPTLRAQLGQIILAFLFPFLTVAAVVLLKAKGALPQIIIGAGVAIGLVIFLAALYKKYSVLYRLSTQRFFVYRGLVSRKIEELELFRVRDIQVTQTILERILKFGKMMVYSTDQTSPKFEISGIGEPLKVKDTIRVQYRIARQRERVRPTEFISDFDVEEAAVKDPSL